MMKEVNNFYQLSDYLNFNNNNIILVWIVQRNKDWNKSKGTNRNRTIKSYHFQSLEQFQSKQDEIISLCKEFQCRAYICINAKPVMNVLFTLQDIVMNSIHQMVNNNNSIISLKGMLDSAVMKSGSDGDKLWIIDVDDYEFDNLTKAKDFINQAQSEFDKNVVTIISTVHGFHIITHPFDTRNFSETFPSIEIKKEGLTLLYAYVSA